MSTNRIRGGHTLTWTNGTGNAVVSGQPVLVGKKLGIATTDIPVNATGELDMDGVFLLVKDTASGSGGGQGADCFFIATTSKITAHANNGASPPVVYTRVGYFAAVCLDADVGAALKLGNA